MKAFHQILLKKCKEWEVNNSQGRTALDPITVLQSMMNYKCFVCDRRKCEALTTAAVMIKRVRLIVGEGAEPIEFSRKTPFDNSMIGLCQTGGLNNNQTLSDTPQRTPESKRGADAQQLFA